MADDEMMPAAPGAPQETPPPATAEAAAAEAAEGQGSGEPTVDGAAAERALGEDERAADQLVEQHALRSVFRHRVTRQQCAARKARG